jgi:hypothetical protein
MLGSPPSSIFYALTIKIQCASPLRMQISADQAELIPAEFAEFAEISSTDTAYSACLYLRTQR